MTIWIRVDVKDEGDVQEDVAQEVGCYDNMRGADDMDAHACAVPAETDRFMATMWIWLTFGVEDAGNVA